MRPATSRTWPPRLLKRAGWTRRPMPVVTTGGVFQSSILIRRAFARHLRRFAPQARVEMLERPPVEGALWLARTLGQEEILKNEATGGYRIMYLLRKDWESL